MSEVYLISSNGKLSVANNTFRFTDIDGTCRTIFPHLTDRLVILGSMNITAKAFSLLMRNAIPVLFHDHSGKIDGVLDFARGKNVFLHKAQYRLLDDSDRRLAIARSIAKGKALNQRRFLQRHSVSASCLDEMSRLVGRMDQVKDLDGLRGEEGACAATYFRLMKSFIPEWTGFDGRNRRPPKDPFNCALSYLYSLLASRVLTMVVEAGLDPAVGVYHELAYGRDSLACDLMEEFRVALADSIACAMFNRRQLSCEDFEMLSPGEEGLPVRIRKEAVKRIIAAFEDKMHTEVQYPPTGNVLPYWKIIQRQVLLYKAALCNAEVDYIPVYFR